MASKSKDAFRTISEVAKWLDVPAHVLRFWESKFPQIKPVKRAGGRRYYRPADMVLIGGIKTMLHDQGLTIRGVQKKLKEDGVEAVSALSPAVNDKNTPEPPSKVVKEVASSSPEPEIEEAPFIEAIEDPIETGGDNVVSLQREDAPAQDTASKSEQLDRPVEEKKEEEPEETPAPLETKSIDMPAAPDLDAVTVDASRQAAAETMTLLRTRDVRNLVGREDIAYLEHKARVFRDKLAAAVGEQDD